MQLKSGRLMQNHGRGRRSRACLHIVFALVGAVLLAACSPADPSRADLQAAASKAAATAAAGKVSADVYIEPGAVIPRDANERGMWSRVFDWPLVAVHVVLLPDGRVLSYGSATTGQQTGYIEYAVWEGIGAPDRGQVVRSNNTGVDLFCSTPLVVPGTRTVFIGGGDIWSGGRTLNIGTAATTLLTMGTTAVAGSGSVAGLLGQYFPNPALTGNAVFERNENVDFDWGTAAPAPGIGNDNFAVRWTGTLTPATSGAHRFQTLSDDGVRLTINGVRLIDNWAPHAPTIDTSAPIELTAGQRYDVTLEFNDVGGGATMRWRWQTPGSAAFVPVPLDALWSAAASSASPDVLSRGGTMNRARWYATTTMLTNGEMLLMGGDSGFDRPEIRDRSGNFRLLPGADTSALRWFYPRNHLQADNRVFGYDVDGRMYFIDPATGRMTGAGFIPGFYVGWSSSSVMFRSGRILQFGGNGNGAIVIDVRSGTPVLTPTQSMSSQRQWVVGTLLPNGDVLATSGSRIANELVDVNNSAEIWNPQTGQWRVGASGAVPRLYHSNALLLPDASVLVVGGGASAPLNPLPLTNRNAELYYPPYLFAPDGRRAPRPQIDSAPSAIDIGRTFALDVPLAENVARVTLVKTGSATHSFNQDQRFLELTFVAAGSRLNVQAPTRASEAPPGYYMLFVIDQAGVPSVAEIVSIGIAANPDPQITPTLASIANQSTDLPASITLPIEASDPNGDPLTFTATGLPTGLSLDAATGVISGTPTRTGIYTVGVVASDGVNSASTGFVWTVRDPREIEVRALPAAAPALAGAAASFSISVAGGVNPVYRWNFGDGSDDTAWSSEPTARHAYLRGGIYAVTVSITDDTGQSVVRSFPQTVYLPTTPNSPALSSGLLLERRATGNPRLWVANPDGDSVTVFDSVTLARIAEIPVDRVPQSLAITSSGQVWVVNTLSATISVIDAASLRVVQRMPLPAGSQPRGIAVSPTEPQAYIALEGTRQLHRYRTDDFVMDALFSVDGAPRNLSISADGLTLYVSQFISRPVPGEHTAVASPNADSGGEIFAIDTRLTSAARRIVLNPSRAVDTENSGGGVPNYLGAAAISPDGTQAWVPAKQDNIFRGALRDGSGLNFQNTVRAISARIDLARDIEEMTARVDHDNAAVASAAAYDPLGVYLFVALETSREVAILDAHSGRQIMRVATGRTPQAVTVSQDGLRLFVHNFMDRTIGVYDLRPLTQQGILDVPQTAVLATQQQERLDPQLLRGKQLFYDAADGRLARDSYLSCGTCHAEGGHDGRVWDLSGFGEGLRNTISLRGHSVSRQGRLHWTGNFDEVQDFEGQIREMQGGTGLLSSAQLATGTRAQPLGDPKAGLSADLDALAAYVDSLATFDASPFRNGDRSLTEAAVEGRTLFLERCSSCHAGAEFTDSSTGALHDIGTIVQPGSGRRLGQTLSGIDAPSLRDAWATAPYLHDGSAPTLEAAIRAHLGVSVTDAEVAPLVAYVQQIGSEERVGPSGLVGEYFAGATPGGAPLLTRVENPDFDWDQGRPAPALPADNFAVRWTGTLTAPVSGEFPLQTLSDDGVRVWLDGMLVIDNWTPHAPTIDTSRAVRLLEGQRYAVRVEYNEFGGGAVLRLRWQPPGAAAFVSIPPELLGTH